MRIRNRSTSKWFPFHSSPRSNLLLFSWKKEWKYFWRELQIFMQQWTSILLKIEISLFIRSKRNEWFPLRNRDLININFCIKMLSGNNCCLKFPLVTVALHDFTQRKCSVYSLYLVQLQGLFDQIATGVKYLLQSWLFFVVRMKGHDWKRE